MRISPAIVLTVFCAMIFLQLGCTGGWLSHCAHQVAHHEEADPCPEDRCGDDFSVPGKVLIKQLGSDSSSTFSALPHLPVSAIASAANHDDLSVVSMGCGASGTYPLLI